MTLTSFEVNWLLTDVLDFQLKSLKAYRLTDESSCDTNHWWLMNKKQHFSSLISRWWNHFERIFLNILNDSDLNKHVNMWTTILDMLLSMGVSGSIGSSTVVFSTSLNDWISFQWFSSHDSLINLQWFQNLVLNWMSIRSPICISEFVVFLPTLFSEIKTNFKHSLDARLTVTWMNILLKHREL